MLGLYKHFTLVCFVISLFLLGFLLIGCAGSSSAYSSVYLVRMSFNASSALLANALAPDIVLRANYVALCVTAAGAMLCAGTPSAALQSALAANILGETLSLATLAADLQRVCRPYVLVATIVLLFAVVLLTAWLNVPCVPGQFWAGRAAGGATACAGLLWGIGAMLQHQAVASAQRFAEAASVGAVEVTRGARAEAMAWTAFAFIQLGFLGVMVRVVRLPRPQAPVPQKC